MKKCAFCKAGRTHHDKCDDCGQVTHMGDWPYCPHGLGGYYAVKFEAYIDKNLGGTSKMSTEEKIKIAKRGIEIRTRGQHERAMKERGLAPLRDYRPFDSERSMR